MAKVHLTEDEISNDPDGLVAVQQDGFISNSIIPSLAITNVYAVMDDTERDNLTNIETGDIAIVTSSSEAGGEPATYIWDGVVWKKILTPTDKVTSVFGRQGIVTAETGDYSFNQISGSIGDTQVPLSAVVQYEGDLVITESQISDLKNYLTSVENSDLTGLNISELNNDTGYITSYTVTQSDVFNFVDDTVVSTNDLWTSDKINTEIQGISVSGEYDANNEDITRVKNIEYEDFFSNNITSSNPQSVTIDLSNGDFQSVTCSNSTTKITVNTTGNPGSRKLRALRRTTYLENSIADINISNPIDVKLNKTGEFFFGGNRNLDGPVFLYGFDGSSWNKIEGFFTNDVISSEVGFGNRYYGYVNENQLEVKFLDGTDTPQSFDTVTGIVGRSLSISEDDEYLVYGDRSSNEHVLRSIDGSTTTRITGWSSTFTFSTTKKPPVQIYKEKTRPNTYIIGTSLDEDSYEVRRFNADTDNVTVLSTLTEPNNTLTAGSITSRYVVLGDDQGNLFFYNVDNLTDTYTFRGSKSLNDGINSVDVNERLDVLRVATSGNELLTYSLSTFTQIHAESFSDEAYSVTHSDVTGETIASVRFTELNRFTSVDTADSDPPGFNKKIVFEGDVEFSEDRVSHSWNDSVEKWFSLEDTGTSVFVKTDKTTVKDSFDVSASVENIRSATFQSEYDNGDLGSSATIDWNNGGLQRATINQDNPTLSFTNPVGVGRFDLRFVATTNVTDVTLPISVVFAGDPPSWSDLSSGDELIITFRFDSDGDYVAIPTPVYTK